MTDSEIRAIAAHLLGWKDCTFTPLRAPYYNGACLKGINPKNGKREFIPGIDELKPELTPEHIAVMKGYGIDL